jgi:putative N6-adenine-specific DNA methylase
VVTAPEASAPAHAGEPGPRAHTRHHHQVRNAETWTIYAPCPQGLEAALADELRVMGFADAKPARAGCRFTADWTGVMRANLHSRLATRILVQLAHAPIAAEADILALSRGIRWERWFGPDDSLRVDTSAIRSPMQSLQYCNLLVKDGICDRLRDIEGARPDIDTVRPDARVHLFLSEDTATIYLDTSGESLFKRGWRLEKGEAPLRENLAAGMLALSGWDGTTPLVDPFCGSGTILIEAAYRSLGLAPGIARPFGFERLRDHDARLWRDLKEDARAQALPALQVELLGSDTNPHAIEAARSNLDRARLGGDTIRFRVCDARSSRPPEGPAGWIVTNPPYGERMENTDAALWQEWSGTLKQHFGGWQLHAITSDRDLPRHLRLNPRRRTPLYNGAIECRLFGFELVAGGYRRD